MAAALVLGASARKGVRVRVPSRALYKPYKDTHNRVSFCFRHYSPLATRLFAPHIAFLPPGAYQLHIYRLEATVPVLRLRQLELEDDIAAG